MESTIRLLEERVAKVVERLRALSAERGTLREDARKLRRQLEGLERGGAAAGRSADRGGREPQIAAIADELRQAARELRGR